MEISINDVVEFKSTKGFKCGTVKSINNKTLVVTVSEWKRDTTGKLIRDTEGKFITIDQDIIVSKKDILKEF